MCTLWVICSSKYRWGADLYDSLFQVCVALTNVHALKHPLRAIDGESYVQYRNNIYNIGDQVVNKRKMVQDRYRRKRKRRLEASFYAPEGDDDMSE